MNQYTVSLTLQIPQALVHRLGTTQALQGFLLDQGLWPLTAQQRRWTIDPVTQGYVIELELLMTFPPCAP